MGEAVSNQALRHTGNKWLRKNRAEVATASRRCGRRRPELEGGVVAREQRGRAVLEKETPLPQPPHEHWVITAFAKTNLAMGDQGVGAGNVGPYRPRTGLTINHNPWLTTLLCGHTWLTFI